MCRRSSGCGRCRGSATDSPDRRGSGPACRCRASADRAARRGRRTRARGRPVGGGLGGHGVQPEALGHQVPARGARRSRRWRPATRASPRPPARGSRSPRGCSRSCRSCAGSCGSRCSTVITSATSDSTAATTSPTDVRSSRTTRSTIARLSEGREGLEVRRRRRSGDGRGLRRAARPPARGRRRPWWRQLACAVTLAIGNRAPTLESRGSAARGLLEGGIDARQGLLPPQCGNRLEDARRDRRAGHRHAPAGRPPSP